MWTIFLIAATFACASPLRSRRSYTIKETHIPSIQWRKTGPVSDDYWIHLEIGLRQAKSSELERHLYEVSDPAHDRYGRHLSAEDVNALVAPKDESITLVEEWLRDHDILDFQYNSARDWIRTGPIHISNVEYLLDTKYYVFRHVEDETPAIRTPGWSLPSHLHDHIDAIQPTTSFLQLRKRNLYPHQKVPYQSPDTSLKSRSPQDEHNLGGDVPTYRELEAQDTKELGHIQIPTIDDVSSNPTVAEACNNLAFSALCIRVLYKTFGYKPQVPGKGRIGVVNYLGESNNETDTQAYLQRYRPDAAKAGAAHKIKTKLINQVAEDDFPSDPHQIESGVGLEAALDIETLIGIAHPIPITAYNVGGRPPFKATKGYDLNINEPYLAWIHHMLSLPQEELPQVITTSYGEPEQTVPPAYAQRVCQGFAQLGARGVSLIFASGDQGVGIDGQCFSNDGQQRPTFQPDFPGGCPFITAVGGTRELSPEIAAFNARTDYVTGGGFSGYFTRPKFQDNAVNTYLNHRLEPGKFNRQFDPRGRGIPDVAAASYHYSIIHEGQSHLSDGTSAASPTFAAVIALLNDALMASGRSPLGFLNPWLYSEGWKGLNDIVHGSNHGCNTTGFPALAGWDPVTGLGLRISPN